MNDIRFALRQFRKAPGFTITAVIALALGIGANAAIFSIIHGVLLKPLPFPHQERLVFMTEWSEQVPNMSISLPNLLDFQTRQTSFEAFGGSRNQGFNFVGEHETERLAGSMASHGLFQALGAKVVQGRLFSEADDQSGAEPTALVRASLWKRQFGEADDIVGRQITLSGKPFTVIGVLPDSFKYPNPDCEVWVPLGLYADTFVARDSHPGIVAVGLRKPGVSFEAAESEMKGIATQLADEYPDTNARQSIAMQPLVDRVFGGVRTPLYVLFAAAGCVLLIACANVANLQLARAQAREREFAVRAALGAGRARIARQLMVESVLLGIFGLVVGLVVGWAALSGLRAVLPGNLPRLDEVSLDPWVIAFAGVVSILTSILFGIVPSWHASRHDVQDALAQGGRSVATGGRVRSSLVVVEFALTCVLLIGAGLMVRTMVRLYQADPGYSTEHLVSFTWGLPYQKDADEAARQARIEAVLERLRSVPGVSQAGVIDPLPLSGSGNQRGYFVEGSPPPEAGKYPSTEVFNVSNDTLATLHIPLVSGRGFTVEDHAKSRPVVIVDTEFVRKNFRPGADPIGRRFTYGDPRAEDAMWLEIIGVTAHIENYGLGRDTREQSYIPISQEAPFYMSFLVRSSGDPDSIMASVRSAMREVTPDVPIFSLRTMDEMFADSISPQRLTVVLLASFAVLALVLAAVGLYGVLSFTVGQRTREIGVRMALGATTMSVVRLMIRYGLLRAGVGLMIGVAGAVMLTEVLKSVLFEVSPLDLWSYSLVVVLLVAVGVLACWLPARRASRIHPLEALRSE